MVDQIDTKREEERIRTFSDRPSLRHSIHEDSKEKNLDVKRRLISNDEKLFWLDLQKTDGDVIRTPSDLEDQLVDPPMEKIDANILDRVQGSLLGLAIGDALGAHVEFRPRQYLEEHPVQDMQGGGTWGLDKGKWTDDTSMALCLANSLIHCQDFIPYDQLVRYKWWFREGYMSSTGHCFDIGGATSSSLQEFERRQNEFREKHRRSIEKKEEYVNDDLMKKFDVYCSAAEVAGNGGLMRLAPVPLFFYRNIFLAIEFSGRSSEITHGDRRARDAARYYGALIAALLRGFSKEQVLHPAFYTQHRKWFGDEPLHPEIVAVIESLREKRGGYEDGIRGKGFVVPALEAALWAFRTTKTFAEGALAAVNLGDDTDTTAAIYGQLAGAHYGYKGLPPDWIDVLYAKKYLLTLSKWIVYQGEQWENDHRKEFEQWKNKTSP